MSCEICEAKISIGQRCALYWGSAEGPSCAKCGAVVLSEGQWTFYYLGRYLGNLDWHHAFLRADGRAFVCPGCGWMHQIVFRPCGEGLRSDLFAGVEAALAVRRELEQAAGLAGKVQEANVEQPQRTAGQVLDFGNVSGSDAGGRGTGAEGSDKAKGGASGGDSEGSIGELWKERDLRWKKFFGIDDSIDKGGGRN